MQSTYTVLHMASVFMLALLPVDDEQRKHINHDSNHSTPSDGGVFCLWSTLFAVSLF